MDFLQAITEVTSITKRPDLIDSIKREINSALNFCSTEGNFRRDTDEVLIDFNIPSFNPVETIQSIPLSAIPRFRKFIFIRPIDRGCYIKLTQPEEVFHMGRESCDVYYVTGSTLKIKLAVKSAGLIVGYFTYPAILVLNTDTNWMLEVSPYMIIHRAAASLFSQVGNTVETNKHEQLFAMHFTSAQRDYKYGADYG